MRRSANIGDQDPEYKRKCLGVNAFESSEREAL
jgi:hypothetical protein